MSKMSQDTETTVYVTPEAWNKMSYWAALGGQKSREFTCFGRAVCESGQLRVTDCYLVKQEGSSGGVDGDDADINRLMMELFAEGIEPDEAFRCWIHSHPGTGKGATYLSGTDDANIERCLTGQWLISIVLDSQGDFPFVQIDIAEPRMSIKGNLEIEMPKMTAAIKEAAKKDFEEKSSGIVSTWKPGQARGGGHIDKDGYRHFGSGGSYMGGGGGYGGGDYERGRSGYEGIYSGGGTSIGSKTGDSGKANGAAQKPISKSGGAEKEDTGTGQIELEGMTMLGSTFGGNEDEYDAWLEFYSAEDMIGVPGHVTSSDTDKVSEIDVPVEVIELNADNVPEWVVSMSETMGCTVSDLYEVVEINEMDSLIDKIVEQVQIGHKQPDTAVGDLVKLGLSEQVAKAELTTRVNA